MSVLTEHLRWRYATKKFDSSKKLSPAQLDELLEAVRLSASSYGLQPYKILVITDPDLRAKLKEKAWGQAQITDASHLLVFCAMKTMDDTYVDGYMQLIAQERGLPAEKLQGFREMILGMTHNRSPEQLADWMKRQTYLALGFALCAAAQMEIDSCPMEGFDPGAFDEILGLHAQNLTATAVCPVGFRTADDETAQMKKVRYPKETLFHFRT